MAKKIHRIWDENYGELNRRYWEHHYQLGLDHERGEGFADISTLTSQRERVRVYDEKRNWPMYLNPLAKFTNESY
jgi:hypothetical protein